MWQEAARRLLNRSYHFQVRKVASLLARPLSSSLAYYRRFDERNCYRRCIRCGSMQRRRDGHTRLGGQRILLVLRPSLCSLARSVTTPLYNTTGSQALACPDKDER